MSCSVRPFQHYVYRKGTLARLRTMKVTPLTKLLVVVIRLSTMLCSCDVENLHTAIFEVKGMYVPRAVDKVSKKFTICIADDTLLMMVYYLHQSRFAPAPFVVGHCNIQALCTGKECIVKLTLGVMNDVGLEMNTLKAH